MMRLLLLLSLYLPLVSGCHVNPTTKAVWKETTTGDIGGGGDSVALWLAIAGLVLLPIASLAGAMIYQHVLRPRRIMSESSSALAEKRNSKHNGA
jgi:hypothetical protein